MADIDTSGYSSVPVEMLISLLPEWLAVQTGDDPANTMYRKVLEAFADVFARPVGLMRMSDSSQWLSDTSRTYPRLLWTAPVSQEDLKAGPITVRTEEYTYLREVESQSELLFADDPVFCVSSDGLVYMRNLAQTTCEMTVSAPGKYQLTPGLITDEPVWLLVNGRWEMLSSNIQAIDWESKSIDFGEAGTMYLKYASQEQLESVAYQTITVGSSIVKATLHDSWNIYDEAGLLVSLSRIPGEENATFAERIRTGYSLLRKSEEDLSKSLLGHELGLVGLLPWTGSEDLDLDDFDIDEVTYVTVLDLDRTKRVTGEVLVPDAENKIYTSSAAAWDPGWMVFVNGTRVTEKTYTGINSSDVEATGRVDFGEEVLGNVAADYSCPLYTATINTGHAVVAKTPNTPVGTYTVLYVRFLEAHSTLDPEFVSRLYDDDGNPTDLYMQITEAAATASPILIGRTGWGDGAHWFDDTESTPPISYLPVPIK